VKIVGWLLAEGSAKDVQDQGESISGLLEDELGSGTVSVRGGSSFTLCFLGFRGFVVFSIIKGGS